MALSACTQVRAARIKTANKQRASYWRAKSAATEEKRSLQRARNLVYKPSAFGVLPAEDDGAPVKFDPRNYMHMGGG